MSHQVARSTMQCKKSRNVFDIKKNNDEFSKNLMIEYFMEDEEYKGVLKQMSRLSPSSLRQVMLVIGVKDWH